MRPFPCFNYLSQRVELLDKYKTRETIIEHRVPIGRYKTLKPLIMNPLILKMERAGTLFVIRGFKENGVMVIEEVQQTSSLVMR